MHGVQPVYFSGFCDKHNQC